MHEDYIAFIRKYRDTVRKPNVAEEIKAVADVFHSDDVECLFCESSAMVGHTSSWQNPEDDDACAHKYEDIVYDVFGAPTSEGTHERCLYMDDMHRLCRDARGDYESKVCLNFLREGVLVFLKT